MVKELKDKNGFIPKYVKLYEQYKSLILEGGLSGGDKLPSIRTNSQNFNLSRTTVEAAYALLAAEGYIISKAQSGFYVCSADFEKIAQIKKGEADAASDKPNIKYDLVSSSADRESFNFALWRRYVKSALRQDERLLSYGEPQGEADLREAICSYIGKERNVICTPKQIVIAAGTQNLIGILCAIASERKDVIFVGSRFDGGKAVFEDYGKNVAAMLSVPERIGDLAKYNASMIYTSPSHIDSWGNVLGIRQRMEMLEFAHEHDCLIIEDDYDSEFRLNGKPIPPLFSMDACEKVIYMNTFSKSLTPTIRISYMVLPVHLINRFYRELSFYACTVSNFEQYTLAAFIRKGYFEKHINRMRLYYSRQRKKMIETIRKSRLHDVCEIMENDSGLHFLIRIKTDKEDGEILRALRERGIRVNALSEYFFTPSDRKHCFIINYSNIDTEKAGEACDIFYEMLTE